MKTINKAQKLPFLRLLLPFIFGIFLADFTLSNVFVSEQIVQLERFLVLLLLVLNILLLVRYKKHFYTSIFIISFLVLIGFMFHFHHSMKNTEQLVNEVSMFTGIVSDIKPVSDHTRIITLEATTNKYSDKWYKCRFYIIKDTHNVHPGHILVFNAKVNDVINRGNPGEFDYKAYLNRKHIIYSGSVLQYKIVDSVKTLNYRIWKIRSFILDQYEKADFNAQNKALIFALTTGDKQFISDAKKSTFADAGIIHMLAVSGLHVGIIYMFIGFLLKPFSIIKKSKIGSLLIKAVLLMIYALFTGMSPSVMRAVIMFILIDITIISQKKHLMFNVLVISAFIILLIDTHYLFEPGYWLSYGAVISILVIMQMFRVWLRKQTNIIRRFYELALVSFAAQPGTLPLVLLWFGRFPVYFLLTNLMVLPLLGFVMVYNYLFLLVGLTPFQNKVFGFPLEQGLSYINWLPEQIASLKGSVIECIDIDGCIMVGMYVLLFLLIRMIKQQNLRQLKIIAIVAIVLISYEWFYAFVRHSENEVVVFNTHDELVICNRSGIYCDIYGAEDQYCVENYIQHFGIKKTNELETEEFLFLQKEVFQLVNSEFHLLVDPGFKRHILMEQYNENLKHNQENVKSIIVTSKCSESDRLRIFNLAKNYNLPCYNIKSSGAWKRAY